MSDVAAIAEIELRPPTPAAGRATGQRLRALLHNPSGVIGLVLIAIPTILTLLAVTGLLPDGAVGAGPAERGCRDRAPTTSSAPTSSVATCSPGSPPASPTQRSSRSSPSASPPSSARSPGSWRASSAARPTASIGRRGQRPVRVPAAAPRALAGVRARPQPVHRGAGDRRRLHADLHPGRARPGAVAARGRVRPGSDVDRAAPLAS